MSHVQQQDFVKSVKQKYPNFFTNKKVLEIGSFNVNGTVRIFFENCDYTGLDLLEGTGVDVVCFGHEYKAPDKSYDTLISCNCFEHDMFYEKTFLNMFRMCKPKGLIIFSSASTGTAEHGTRRTSPQDSLSAKIPELSDYYKNLVKEDFTKLLNFDDLFENYEFSTNEIDLYFYGIKK